MRLVDISVSSLRLRASEPELLRCATVGPACDYEGENGPSYFTPLYADEQRASAFVFVI